MDIVKAISESIAKANHNHIAIFLTAFVAGISWIAKGLLEKPFSNARETFFRYVEKRITILTKIKVRLLLISYFPDKDGKDYKNQLQSIVLEDEDVAYLSSNLLASTLRISIDPKSNEKLILSTLSDIDNELASQISKIKSENRFYTTFSNQGPQKRVYAFALLILHYLVAIGIVVAIMVIWAYFMLFGGLWIKLLLLILACGGITLINKWLK